MAELSIPSARRAAAFLAQLAHESGELHFMEEIWGSTDAQRRYEPLTKLSQALSNTEAGDGRPFKGRGPIQLTGRLNDCRFGSTEDRSPGRPAARGEADVAFRIAGSLLGTQRTQRTGRCDHPMRLSKNYPTYKERDERADRSPEIVRSGVPVLEVSSPALPGWPPLFAAAAAGNRLRARRGGGARTFAQTSGAQGS